MASFDHAEIINLILRFSHRSCREKNPQTVGEYLAERSDGRFCRGAVYQASFFKPKLKAAGGSVVPNGTQSHIVSIYPPLKRWAIFKRL
jgi:hypothetical protein